MIVLCLRGHPEKHQTTEIVPAVEEVGMFDVHVYQKIAPSRSIALGGTIRSPHLDQRVDRQGLIDLCMDAYNGEADEWMRWLGVSVEERHEAWERHRIKAKR